MTSPWHAELLDWDDDNEAELAAHHITPAEVHQVWENEPVFVPNRRHRAGDWKLVGQTHGGRRLTIVARFYEDRKLLRPITGWESTRNEQSRYGR
jgi:uncharacterized DUF497 family protein